MGTIDYVSWARQLQDGMDQFGLEAVEARRYMQERRIRLGVHDQPTGARWTVDRRIEIHPRYAAAPDDARAVSLVIHEVRHLQQGPLTALSVYGELEAWQLQFRFIKKALGECDPSPRRAALLEQIIALPLGWDRSVLHRVRGLMQSYAGKAYRIDLLPLYPLHRELWYLVSRNQPSTPTLRN